MIVKRRGRESSATPPSMPSRQVAGSPGAKVSYHFAMGRHLLLLMLLTSACKAELADVKGSLVDGDGGVTDALADDSSVPFDTALPAFGTPMLNNAASSPTLAEDDGALTSDGLEMVFAVAATGGKDLFYTKRASLTSAWATATKLAISAVESDETPRFSPDDLTLYYASARTGTLGSLDIFQTTRPAKGSTAFGVITAVAGPSSTLLEKTYTPCNGSYVVVVAGDLAEGTVGAAPMPITVLNDATGSETGPFLTADCLRIYFASTRDGTAKIYASSRASMTAPWAAPALATDIPSVTGATGMEDPWFSPDERILSFAATVAGGTKDQYIIAR